MLGSHSQQGLRGLGSCSLLQIKYQLWGLMISVSVKSSPSFPGCLELTGEGGQWEMLSSSGCQWLQGGFGKEGKIQQESKHKRIPKSSCSPHSHPSVGNPVQGISPVLLHLELKLSEVVELKNSIGVIQIRPLH